MNFQFRVIRISKIVAFVFILISLANLKSDNLTNDIKNVLGFDKGIHPVGFDLKTDSIRDKNTGKLLESAADCKSCHKEIYENWFSSRHRVAHTNKLYRHSFSVEPMEWCENCHSPLKTISSNSLYKPEEGISCNVCHVRSGHIITEKLPSDAAKLYHQYKVVPDFASDKLCGSCHQFNFPTWQTLSNSSKTIQYSSLTMQGTVEEWENSGFAKDSDCLDCHLSPGTKKSHNFRGGHSLEDLKKSLMVEAKYVSSKTIMLKVKSIGIGHAYPTGDLFRALRLKVFSKDGVSVGEYILRKLYKVTSREERADSSNPKKLLYDTRIPAPDEGQNWAEKEFYLDRSDRPRSLKIELWIDYLNDVEKILSPIDKKESMKNIIRETIIIEDRNEYTEKESG
ncbi:multiheme c-type cytochrome [Leptospira neocaledonica]|uniref:Cytochrome c-552/4 domain-containing protein n=1 Tax=Leptospira neocaledonica TaxID=2023192 RepID=A0A2N0A176_9LEPT|nr:multiheme c-type cytochrome [Leptospira neocaledonica]PJZ78074.1 hypothetical protein CH365_06560 [Leptospira neocaledonica]